MCRVDGFVENVCVWWLEKYWKIQNKTSSSDLTGIPVFKFSELRNKDEIKSVEGAFQQSSQQNYRQAVKRLSWKIFLTMTSTRSANCLKKRDYWTLCDIQISLVWKQGRCSDRYALLLEYICLLRPEAIRREQDCQLFTSLASVFRNAHKTGSLANIAREWLTFLKTALYVSFMSKLKLPIIHMNVFDITYLLKALKAKKFRVIPLSVFYPPIRVLSPHPCFIPPSVFYPLIRVLSPHPCFIPSSVFYPLIRVLSPHPCFIPPSVFYPPIRVLSPHPCFIPSSVFYPLIRVLSPHPCFIPSSVFYPPSVFYPLVRVLSPRPCFIPSSVFYPLIRIRIRQSVSVFYPNPISVGVYSSLFDYVHATQASFGLLHVW